MVIVLAFLLLILAAALGLVAEDWQKTRSACPTRRRPSWARPEAEATGTIEVPKGPERRHLERHRPAGAQGYKEWAETGQEVRDRRRGPSSAETLPFGGDRARPRRARQGHQGRADSRCSSAWLAALRRHADRHAARRAGRLLRRQGGRLPRVALQRLHRDPGHPADLRVRGGAEPGRGVIPRSIGRADPRAGRLDRACTARCAPSSSSTRSREYVRAAEAIGASTASRIFRHILPNVSHVVLVRMSPARVGFIKSEVILSYLGLGVPVDQVSWGTMLPRRRRADPRPLVAAGRGDRSSWRCSSPPFR